MELISTQWIDYLHKYKAVLEGLSPTLFQTLYEYNLKKFTFEIQEGYREPDTGRTNFPRFIFTYITCKNGEEIEVEVSTTYNPLVKIEEQELAFTDYFCVNESQSRKLQAFFYTFGATLIRY